MGLFSKKKEECCGGGCTCDAAKAPAENQSRGAAAKILGGGCSKCNALEENTLEALKQLGMDAAIDHVRDYAEIASYGVMTTPALVYQGKVISYGKVLSVKEIVALLQGEV